LVDGNHEYTVFNRAIGTGPFIMESYDTLGDGGRIKYVRNPDYFKKGQPFFDAMELPIVTSSETIQAMFLQGDTDTSGTGLDATLTAALKEARPDMKTFEASGFFLFKVYWDMANQDSPWARDVRMRQAMWYFMPYDALLNQLGVTCCRTGPMPPGQKPWALPNEDLPGSGLDLQSSIQEGLKLLDAAGYPAGTEIPLELSISNFYGGDLLGEVLTAIFGGLKQASGGALNINVRLNVMELGSWLKDVYRGGGTFEATSHADAVFHDPDNGFYRYYHSTGVANNTHLNDPKVDDFLERQRREFDHEKRVEVVHEFQRYLLDISPTVYIVAPNSFSGAQPWVENYKTHTIGYLETLRHWDELWFNETAPQR
ncbi:MAG TPA: ABC transporter substrate-binding protein, partial [Dehalococcoidia bacterium]|nr:ABC transporter substrate-binding protein [Dehalococcoidia bacterium]